MRNTICNLATAAILLATTSGALAAPICGDLNDSGNVSTGDALLLLRSAVGQPVDLVCDRCGSTCEGDPRYLLGEWRFESNFDGTVYEDDFSLFAVDEEYCEIVGQAYDDLGIVFAYAADEFDYALIATKETFCDLFVFDRLGPSTVDGFDLGFDYDEDGNCDFDAPLDEGTTFGFRLIAEGVGGAASVASTQPQAGKAKIDRRRAAGLARQTLDLDPRVMRTLEKLRSMPGVSQRRRR